MQSTSLPFISALAILSSAISVNAADWTHWRGPNYNGISTETGWQAKWSAEGPKQLWKASLGTGFSSMTVVKNRVFAMGNTADTDTVFCLNADDGKEVWKYSYAAKLDPKMFEGGPTCTPTIDGNQVFTMSRQGLVLCLAADTGKVAWQVNCAELGFPAPSWGYSGSGYVDKGLVIFNAGAACVAFDKNTGKIAWQSNKTAPGYSTPVPCTVEGKKIVAVATCKDVIGLEPASGQVLWSYPWQTSYDINAADAIVSGNQVFISSGYGHGASMFEVKDGKATKVWENKSMRNHINSCVLIDGCIYGFDGDAPALDGSLRCMDFKTGETKWSAKMPTGSLMSADGKLIILTSKGELITAEVSPTEFKPISRASVLTGKCWTVPTLANGRIYARNATGDLVCLDVSGK